ncbi:MAG: response regulator transcription factor, partial [Oscillospiraceae bacterium]|nr:response regulator transcription factor [Oscillospiraceae bacterium]
YSGYHWCGEIRKVSRVPVIFISSAAENMNIVMAINMGADDFIAKPFDIDVLVAKVQALLRRTYEFVPTGGLLEHRGAVLNSETCVLSYDGKTAELTKNELKILSLLMERKGHIVSRDALMEHLWATDSYVDENTLTVNMTRLRKKLGDLGLTDFISTKKGQGYVIQ